jgi:hypothetical protein
MNGYMEKEIQTYIAQGLSTEIISMIKWIRNSSLSKKKSLSQRVVTDTPKPKLGALKRTPKTLHLSRSKP